MTEPTQDHTFDVIIIGGGINGCSTALQLARRGVKVAVVEKDNIGDGPTGRSSAIIRQHYSNELTARMAHYSLGVFQDFEEQVGGECGFRRTGFLALAAAKDQLGLEANVALQRGVGIRTELLSAEALHDIMPGIEDADLIAAAWEEDSGYADPYLTVNAYAAAAKRAGARLYTNTAVTGITRHGDRVTGVQTAAGDFSAPVVVNCAGPWGARVARMAGLDIPVSACRVQVSFFRRPPGEEAVHPVVVDFINASYFRSETGNLTLVGLVDPGRGQRHRQPRPVRRGRRYRLHPRQRRAPHPPLPGHGAQRQRRRLCRALRYHPRLARHRRRTAARQRLLPLLRLQRPRLQARPGHGPDGGRARPGRG